MRTKLICIYMMRIIVCAIEYVPKVRLVPQRAQSKREDEWVTNTPPAAFAEFYKLCWLILSFAPSKPPLDITTRDIKLLWQLQKLWRVCKAINNTFCYFLCFTIFTVASFNLDFFLYAASSSVFGLGGLSRIDLIANDFPIGTKMYLRWELYQLMMDGDFWGQLFTFHKKFSAKWWRRKSG